MRRRLVLVKPKNPKHAEPVGNPTPPIMSVNLPTYRETLLEVVQNLPENECFGLCELVMQYLRLEHSPAFRQEWEKERSETIGTAVHAGFGKAIKNALQAREDERQRALVIAREIDRLD